MWQYILHNTGNIYRKKEEKDIQWNKRTLLQFVLSRNYLDILEVCRCKKEKKESLSQARENEKQMAAKMLLSGRKLIADLRFLVNIFSQALLNVYVDFFFKLAWVNHNKEANIDGFLYVVFFFPLRIKVLRCRRWTMTSSERKGGRRLPLDGNDSK